MLMRLLNKLFLFTVLLIFYVMFSGSLSELTIISGVVISATLALVFDGIIIKRELRLKDLRKTLYLLEYLCVYLYYEARAHAKMVRLILGESSHIKSCVIRLNTNLSSEYGRAFLASSITNTPGTLTLHLDEERGIVYVHWLAMTSLDPEVARREIMGKLHDLALKIFG
jgi:multicomponent Na+:H+ antiporter subunit E